MGSAGLAPTVEPLVNLIAYPYYILIPVLPAVLFYRRLAERAGPESRQIPGPAIRAGQTWQFPALWEPLMWSLVNGTAAALLWRDDAGRTVAGRYAARVGAMGGRTSRRRPVLAEVAFAFSLLSVAYLLWMAPFAVLRITHRSASVARPWPFTEVPPYDPQGLYRTGG